MQLLLSTSHGSWFRYCSVPTIFSALPIFPLISSINLFLPPTLSTPLPPLSLQVTCSLIHLLICNWLSSAHIADVLTFTFYSYNSYRPFLPSRPFLRNDPQNEALPNTVTASHADIVARSHLNQRNFLKLSVWFQLSEFNCFVFRHSVDISALWRWELRSVFKWWQHLHRTSSGLTPHGHRCCSHAWGGWIKLAVAA